MRRQSLKKASTFKLQAIRNRFTDYLDSIDSCPAAVKFPGMKENITETSKKVYDLCYSFRDESPFIRGLNYDSKYMGFSISESIVTYREWLPNVRQAYLMGEFNSFNKESHKMEKNEEEGGNWFKLEIDTNQSHLNDGTKIMLRVIDCNGTQSHMIPPSCHIVDKSYGIYRKVDKLLFNKSKLRINELLAYTIDLDVTPLQKCCEFIESEMKILECYNTIILKNLFKNQNGLLYKFSMKYKDVELLHDLISKIKNQCGIKVILEWNFSQGKLQYSGNPIETIFMKKSGDDYEFNVSQDEVLAYYLANISHYYSNFGIDGLHFTNVGNLVKNKEGIVLIKCINTMNDRLSQQSVTLGSSKDQVPGMSETILEGGLGFSFTYNYQQSLLLSAGHCEIFQKLSQIQSCSNCLAVNFNNFSETDYLNLVLAFMMCDKGIFTTGNFSHIREHLKKILKLRRQADFFSDQIEVTKIDKNVIIAQRGSSRILFNFSSEEIVQTIKGVKDMEIIFNESEQDPKIEDDKITLKPRSCLLLEN